MSAIYDNWERLVAAVLKKEQLWQLFHAQSISSCTSSGSSSFSFCHLTSSLDDIPFNFSSPEWFAYDHKDDDFGGDTGVETHSSILVQDQSPVEKYLPSKNVTFTPTRKRDLKVQVPQLQFQDRGFSPNTTNPTSNARVNPRAGEGHSESHTKWHDDTNRQSYPLPLPPADVSRPNSAGKSPSTPSRSPERAAKSPSTPLRSPERAAKSPSTPLRSPKRAAKSPPTPLRSPERAAKSPSMPSRSPERAAKSPSMPSRSPERAENIKRPGTPWKRGKLIGRGPLGDVYLGFNSEKGRMCAMKEVRLSSDDTELKQNASVFEKEIEHLSSMKHPNIVRYYGSEMVADNFYIYYEYISGGPINKILQEYGRLGEPAIRSYTRQILSGLAYLHSRHILHRDIKCANILVDTNGIAKLANFGIEKHIAEQCRRSWVMDSPYWMAPEAIMNPNVCDLAIDIWSLGCTVLEMAASKPPLSQYDRVMAVHKVAYHNELPTIPDHLSDVCKDFLQHCLQRNPLQRSAASQLLEHPFVKYSLPLGKQILFSTSSGHPATTNAVRSEGIDHGRSHHQLDSGKVAFRSYDASKSNYQTSDIYTPRNISPPVSPVSPVVHPRSPQHLNGRMSPPPKTSPHMASTPIVGGVGAIRDPHVNQSMLQHETFNNLPKKSANINSPSYWDPNILRGVFRFS